MKNPFSRYHPDQNLDFNLSAGVPQYDLLITGYGFQGRNVLAVKGADFTFNRFMNLFRQESNLTLTQTEAMTMKNPIQIANFDASDSGKVLARICDG